MSQSSQIIQPAAEPSSRRAAGASLAVSPSFSHFSRRRFLALTAGSLGSLLLSSCGATARPTLSPGEKVQLVYQDWRTDRFPSMAQTMLEEFHATHPNIRVHYIPDPVDLEERMLSDMQQGTAPDVFAGCCHFFPMWAQKGFTLDLRPYVTDLDRETIDDWDRAQYRALFTASGVQYAVPKYHGALGLYYNKDVLDAAQLTYPDSSWTYNDYLAAMRALTVVRRERGEPEGIVQRWGSTLDLSWERLQVHINSFGGHLVDPGNPSRCRMGDPESLAAHGWLWNRIWKDRVLASPLDLQKLGTREAFITGKVAMVEDGSWALRDILTQAKFRVGVAPFPIGPARRVALATTDGFGIYRHTRHPEAAWELLKFLISKEYGRAMAKAEFLQPARLSLVEDWVRYIRDEFPGETRDMDLLSFAEGHRKGYSVTAEVFSNMAEAKRLAYAAWDKLFALNQITVEEMRSVCVQIEKAQAVRAPASGDCCRGTGA